MHAGFCFFDGHPTNEVAAAWLHSLRGPSSALVGHVTAGGATLMCDSSSRSSALVRSRHAPSGTMISWDGHLHNRDELQRRLADEVEPGASDAALALLIYERFGVDGLKWLIGDWSLAIWEPSLRSLCLARDYMGVRPLYYSAQGDVVSWSSSLGELATRTGREDDLDETFAAGFMALRFSTDVTPYRGIRAVPCAVGLRITQDGEWRHAFWRLEPPPVRYPDPRMYADHLRALWRESVGARLGAGDSTWAELSGGLDSSPIVCMAAALIKEQRVAAAAIHPISHVAFDSPESDERRFIDDVESWADVTSTILGVEQYEDLRSADEWVTPFAPRGIQVASERYIAERGGRVILSGRLGDLVMGCTADNSVAAFDAFGEGRIFHGLATLRQWSRSCRKPFLELASALGREGLRATRGRAPGSPKSAARLAGIGLLSDRLKEVAHGWPQEDGPPRVRWSARPLVAAVLACSREGRLENRTADARVAYSYPYAHRPLVEFMAAIPADERSAPANTRALMRRAFEGWVPPRVLRRQSKGFYPPAAMRAVRRMMASRPDAADFEVVRRGWLDAARLADALRATAHGAGQSGGEIQRALILEDWLTRRHWRGHAGSHHREEVTTHGVCNA